MFVAFKMMGMNLNKATLTAVQAEELWFKHTGGLNMYQV
jgi:hypothetical protein